MSGEFRRPLRADAARNVERIVSAARAAFAELGADVALDEIARRAGVGVATLYRRFANREELLRAVARQRFADIDPAVRQALADDDPWRGMVECFAITLSIAAEEMEVLRAEENQGGLFGEFTARCVFALTEFGDRHYDALTQLVRRAQERGALRTDVVPEDLPRLFMMVVAAMGMTGDVDQGWRRYLALLLDGLRPEAARLVLPTDDVTPIGAADPSAP